MQQLQLQMFFMLRIMMFTLNSLHWHLSGFIIWIRSAMNVKNVCLWVWQFKKRWTSYDAVQISDLPMTKITPTEAFSTGMDSWWRFGTSGKLCWQVTKIWISLLRKQKVIEDYKYLLIKVNHRHNSIADPFECIFLWYFINFLKILTNIFSIILELCKLYKQKYN